MQKYVASLCCVAVLFATVFSNSLFAEEDVPMTQQDFDSAARSGLATWNWNDGVSVFAWTYGMPGMLVWGTSTGSVDVKATLVNYIVGADPWGSNCIAGGGWQGIVLCSNKVNGTYNGPNQVVVRYNSGNVEILGGVENTGIGYVPQPVASAPYNIAANAIYVLTAKIINGTNVTASINGNVVLQYTFPIAMSGQYGLVAANCIVQLNSVTVDPPLTILKLVPSALPANSLGGYMHVYGQNFTTNTTANLDGALRTTVYLGANKIRVYFDPDDCVPTTTTHALTLVDPANDSVTVSLNVAATNIGPMGPQGIQGPQGPAGQDGIMGSQGPQGDIGPKGDKGDCGTTGLQGPKGDKGDCGLQGPKGDCATGSQGPIGLTGATGPKGDKGDCGTTGLQGPKGDKGDCGATGPQGLTGPAGQDCSVANGEYIMLDVGDTAPTGYVYIGDTTTTYHLKNNNSMIKLYASIWHNGPVVPTATDKAKPKPKK